MANNNDRNLDPKMFDDVEPFSPANDPLSTPLTGWNPAWGPEPSSEELESEAFDAELVNLFAQLDEVKMSDELFRSTLDALAPESAGAPTLVMAPADKTIQGARKDDEAQAAPVFTVVEGGAEAARPTHRKKRSLAPLAIAAALLLSIIGGIAWFTPSTYITLNANGSVISLGVNVFGTTVSAEALDDEAKSVLNDVDVRNRGYEDSVRAIMGELERRNPNAEAEVSVEVTGGILPDQRKNVEDATVRTVVDMTGKSPQVVEPEGEPGAEPRPSAAPEQNTQGRTDEAPEQVGEPQPSVVPAQGGPQGNTTAQGQQHQQPQAQPQQQAQPQPQTQPTGQPQAQQPAQQPQPQAQPQQQTQPTGQPQAQQSAQQQSQQPKALTQQTQQNLPFGQQPQAQQLEQSAGQPQPQAQPQPQQMQTTQQPQQETRQVQPQQPQQQSQVTEQQPPTQQPLQQQVQPQHTAQPQQQQQAQQPQQEPSQLPLQQQPQQSQTLNQHPR